MGNMVTVASYRDLLEAEIVKGRLEAEGIFCALKDENLVGVNPLYSNAVGGVKLLIREEDYDDVLKLLRDNVMHQQDNIANNVNVVEVGDIAHDKLSILLQTKNGVALFIVIVLLGALGVYALYYLSVKGM